MSVCNGALTLARTGLLDGLKATTHWGSIDKLRQFSKITVVPNDRYVDNGRIIATQGVSAGIDGALHVVERLLGAEAAWSDAHYMMYAWEPAGLSKQAKDELRPWILQDWHGVQAVYERKVAANPKDALATARVGIAQKELGDNARAEKTLERALALGSKDPDAYDELGDARFALGRFEPAARAYEEELPLRNTQAQPWVALSAAKAWSRAGNKEAAVKMLQKAAAGGATDGKALDKDPDLLALHDDPRFAALVRATH
jgi:tetratricopeptide (TPR) repeat protein